MSYDPCGTQRLDGDEIVKRIAAFLGVSPKDLKAALFKYAYEESQLGPSDPEQGASE